MRELWSGLKVIGSAVLGAVILLTPGLILASLGYEDIGAAVSGGLIGVLVIVILALMIGSSIEEEKRRNGT